MDGINFFHQGSGINILGKMGLRDQNYGKKIGINGSRIYHVTTLSTGLRPATLLNSKRAREGILASFCGILWASREILSLKMLSMLSMSSSLK